MPHDLGRVPSSQASSFLTVKWIGPVFPKIGCVRISGLNADSDPGGVGWTRDGTFLTRSQQGHLLPVLGPHFHTKDLERAL